MTAIATSTIESINPATGEVVGSVQITAVNEITEIVAKARAAQPACNELGLDGRAALLRPIADRLAQES